MSLDEDVVSEIIKDGVKIITYKDGSQHFELADQPGVEVKVNDRSWWQKLKDWWNNTPVKPYVKVRDLADPIDKRKEDIFDMDVGCDGKSAVEVGIKISF